MPAGASIVSERTLTAAPRIRSICHTHSRRNLGTIRRRNVSRATDSRLKDHATNRYRSSAYLREHETAHHHSWPNLQQWDSRIDPRQGRSRGTPNRETIMIHLGFEIGTGAPVEIPLGHLAITGQSQASGKTTTLEALTARAGCRSVAFLTKPGESSFRVATPIEPYFRDRVDWPLVASILEAAASEKLKFQRAEIIKLCQSYNGPEGKWSAPKTLADVAKNAEAALLKARGYAARIYLELAEYLQMILPQIEHLKTSDKLNLKPGLNVMDLIEYDFPMQALLVQNVIEWILHHETRTIVAIPEAWKFAPKRRNSPVRVAAEEFIRQGAALKNFLWCDSQDLAGVNSVLLRQVTVWIFGVQRDMR